MNFINFVISLVTVSRVSSNIGCPQRHSAHIPNITDSEILQYIIDGFKCIGYYGVSENKGLIQTAIADIKIVCKNAAAKSTNNGIAVSDQIDQIIAHTIHRITNLSVYLLGIESRLIKRGLQKVGKNKNKMVGKARVLAKMNRARKIVKKKNNQILNLIYNGGQLIIQRVKPASRSIVKLLDSDRDFAMIEIAKICDKVAENTMNIFQDSIIKLQVYEHYKLTALDGVLQCSL